MPEAQEHSMIKNNSVIFIQLKNMNIFIEKFLALILLDGTKMTNPLKVLCKVLLIVKRKMY